MLTYGFPLTIIGFALKVGGRMAGGLGGWMAGQVGLSLGS